MVQVRYTRNLFLRGICVIYLFAFLSFYVQIPGLYGDNGILPARTQLDLPAQTPLIQKFVQKPTFAWFAPYLGINTEYMLDIIALLGSILAFIGFTSQRVCIAPFFVTLWALYNSLFQVGQLFMRFQWDNLLLEAGLLCILIAPFWYPSKRKPSTPSDDVTLWSVRWLLFRLLFSSGVVKLTSGCPSWLSLDALTVHFESQCIPTSLAWYAHHLPVWYLRLYTALVIVFELVIPFLFFFPNRKIRVGAFYLQVFLQVHIFVTGNWNFFNFLVICLSFALLDDQFFYKKKSKNESWSIRDYLSTIVCLLVYAGVIYGTCVFFNLKMTENWSVQSKMGLSQELFEEVCLRLIRIAIYLGVASLGFVVADAVTDSILLSKGISNKLVNTLTTVVYTGLVCFVFAVSVVPFSTLHPSHNATIPTQLKYWHNKVDHLHVAHGYGLFRRMTGIGGRPEIIIEGSNDIDGPWKEYEFLYKPGNVNSSLPFVAPYQPRLDWQMWFAALGTYHQNPWIMSLTYRLLHGQPEVLALLNNVVNPFRNAPPKFIKASLYHYHYVPWSKTWNDETWWTREKVGEYFPVFSRDHPPLIDYLAKMKITQQQKPTPKVTNELLKLILDLIRSLLSQVEGSMLLWSVFAAGNAILLTNFNNSIFKKI